MASLFDILNLHRDNVKERPNPFEMKDELLLKQIVSTHALSDTKLDDHDHVDVHSLFIPVENIITGSTKIIDDFVKGDEIRLENINVGNSLPAGFSSPLCILKQIAHEMSCKDPKEETAHETAISILNILKSHSWKAKAALALAAFAVECGEFWLLSQLQQKSPLAKSVAILKRVPHLTKAKHGDAIAEINKLIRDSLQVIKNIFELERLSELHYVPALQPAIKEKPFYAYWVIITIVAIVTQVDCLIKESKEKLELSHFSDRIKTINRKFSNHELRWKLEIEVSEYHKKLKDMFLTPTEIVEIFKWLFIWKTTPKTPPFYDCSSKSSVEIDVLREKNVFLFISTLSITQEEIDLLKLMYEEAKSGNQYKIVWVPFVKEWNDELKKKFKDLRDMMPWYVLQSFENIQGFKFIEEKWHFQKNHTPMVVHVDPHGMLLHEDAFHMIQVWKSAAFPLTREIQVSLTQTKSWFDKVVVEIRPDIKELMKEKETYIFFYGGKKIKWTTIFGDCAKAVVDDLAKDPATKGIKIRIVPICVQENQDTSIISSFWKAIESFFVTKTTTTTSDAVSQDVRKMLSYKDEKGWALLCKGSTVLVSGHGDTMLKTLQDYAAQWKQILKSKGFEQSFVQHHEKIARANHRCSRFEIPKVAGKFPDSMECLECHQVMEVFISYRCCHKRESAKKA